MKCNKLVDKKIFCLIFICCVVVFMFGCSIFFKIPKRYTFNSFDVLRYYYMKNEKTLVFEFMINESFDSFSDVKIKKYSKDNRNIYKVTILGRYAEPEEWDELEKYIKRIENGNFIFSYKINDFHVRYDKVVYLDGNEEHEIPFAGIKLEPFKQFVPNEFDPDLN